MNGAAAEAERRAREALMLLQAKDSLILRLQAEVDASLR